MRITPAYAGKSSKRDCLAIVKRDHPRACGEKLLARLLKIKVRGSPPRVRGKEAWHERDVTHGGITPARAGKSWLYYKANKYNKDHPRACGEKNNMGFFEKVGQGSPPRVRGKG